MSISRVFKPDHEKYEGVRPINIFLLRTLYFLMAAFVATRAWGTILSHEGPWDYMRAVVFCVWATYPTLALLGLLHPLRMLPILLFMIGYKLLWLVIVAYPLWRAGTLDGPVESIAVSFSSALIAILIVPWKYVSRTFVMGPRRESVRSSSLRSPDELASRPAPTPGRSA